ncbi:MAG: hypothetical protein RLZZ67_174 [Candidatus Parcubacteria bacterium]|jgi:hypothetical protein
MTRSDLINTIIRKHGYGSYLEIGLNTPRQPEWNWPHVEIAFKECVDPNVRARATYPVTSDEFFAKHIKTKYDIVFIDGLHHSEQVYKDIVNSLKWLEEGGTIVVHDCNPPSERSQSREHVSGEWSGDVWKAFLKLRMENPDITMYTVDTNYGCGIIRKGHQELYVPEKGAELEYAYFRKHDKEILNLVSVRQFKMKMGRFTIFDRVINKIKRMLGIKLNF